MACAVPSRRGLMAQLTVDTRAAALGEGAAYLGESEPARQSTWMTHLTSASAQSCRRRGRLHVRCPAHNPDTHRRARPPSTF